MIKKKIAAALAAVMVIGAAGCQENPDTEIVRQKQDVKDAKTVEKKENSSIQDQVKAPSEYKASLKDPKGIVEVEADAVVTVPEVEGIGLKKVTARPFSQQDMDVIYDKIIKKAPLWTRKIGGENVWDGMTKSEIEDQLVYLKKAKEDLAAGDEQTAQIYEGTDLDALIAQYESAYEKAPETPQTEMVEPKISYDEKAASGYANKFKTEEELEAEGIEADSYEGEKNPNFLYANFELDGNEYMVSVTNSLGEEWKWIQFEVSKGYTNYMAGLSEEEMAGAKPIKRSFDEIRAEADKLVEELGFTDMVFSAADLAADPDFQDIEDAGQEPKERHQAYILHYVRETDGIPVIYTPSTGSASEPDDAGQFSATWPYEALTLTYDDEGMTNFSWENPYEVSSQSDEYVFLMPFSDIQKIFEEMVLNKYALNEKEPVRSVIQIDKVCLSYMRIRNKGNIEEGTLVPVWDFFGSRKLYNESGEVTYQEDVENCSYLTINAMDGTIIDRGLGY